MISQSKFVDVYTDSAGLAELRKEAQQKSPESLRAAANQFEALFLQLTLKTMRDAVSKSSLLKSSDQELYNGLFDQQLALNLSGISNLGIADLIYRQLGGEQHSEQGKRFEDYLLDSKSSTSHAIQHTTVDGKWTSAESTGRTSSKVREQEPWSNADEFVNHLKPTAIRAAGELNIAPEAILAVTALETGWGSHVMRNNDGASSFNLFGIKASPDWHGESVVASTLEFVGGAMHKRQELFRSYKSAEESIADFAKLIKDSPRYKNALNTGSKPEAFFSALQDGGYATDPKYANKLKEVLQGQKIQQAFKK